MQQQAEVAAAGASTTTTTNINNTSNVSSASLGIVGGVGGAGMDVPPVTRKQLARLRSMMAHHHQLLVQQATLSVRAAYVQKVRKDGLSSNTSSAATTTNTTAVGEIRRNNMLLPASRLETKSLTFISKPVATECSYENDFFGGETPDELSECLDGSVGMLQDLEQVRFYVGVFI